MFRNTISPPQQTLRPACRAARPGGLALIELLMAMTIMALAFRAAEHIAAAAKANQI